MTIADLAVMNIDAYDEQLLYSTAVENLLLRKQQAPLRTCEEMKLIDAMLKAKRHYTDCVKAIIYLRLN